jgi:hypothetical protein
MEALNGDWSIRRELGVARRTDKFAERREWLLERQAEQTAALREFDESEQKVAYAEEQVAAAALIVEDAQKHADAAYQRLVDLFGASAAKSLIGKDRSPRRTTKKRSSQEAKPTAPSLVAGGQSVQSDADRTTDADG